MSLIPRSAERVIEELGKLPSIGPRTAERLTFYLLRTDPEQSRRLGEAVAELRQGLHDCQRCGMLADQELCAICNNAHRDTKVVAVVEEPLDVVAIEKTALFRGLYHVLGGVISPVDGVGPDQLRIKSLLERAKNEGLTELILATNPSTEGETTAMYIKRQLEGSQIRISRLARGLPMGGDLEYADQITLGRALEGRQAF